MKTELKIIKFFIENNSKQYSINQVAKELGISYKVAFQIISRNIEKGAIKAEKVGNINLCSFNFKFDENIFLTEKLRYDLLKDRKIISVKREVKHLSPLSIVLLFGSYAKGTAHKNSDVDLCIIGNIDFESLNILPYDLHVLDFSYEEFTEMLLSKKPNVAHEIVKNNIILRGIENYYSIFENEDIKR